MSTIQQADRIMHRAKRMVEEYKRLKQRVDALEIEKLEWKKKADADASEIAFLAENIKIIKLARNISSENQENEKVTELKRKINEYIKEIDTCIAMLNEDDE
jgi:anion-transporting  ArsA/GET3 family ATPase